MKVVLDTNAYSEWRRDGRWNGVISQATLVLVPTVVLGELYAGFRLGRARMNNVAGLAKFLNSRCVQVISLTAHTAKTYGKLVSQLRRQGTPLPTNYVWISAFALEWNALLVTRDAHFQHLAQIAVAVETH